MEESCAKLAISAILNVELIDSKNSFSQQCFGIDYQYGW
jgi:hypothetical protein